MEHNGIGDELVLSCALHAVCEKQGPEGIVLVANYKVFQGNRNTQLKHKQ
jgi:hypothetical protein